MRSEVDPHQVSAQILKLEILCEILSPYSILSHVKAAILFFYNMRPEGNPHQASAQIVKIEILCEILSPYPFTCKSCHFFKQNETFRVNCHFLYVASMKAPNSDVCVNYAVQRGLHSLCELLSPIPLYVKAAILFFQHNNKFRVNCVANMLVMLCRGCIYTRPKE